MKRSGFMPGLWHAAKGSNEIDLMRDPSNGRPALFLPGPYYLGTDWKTIHHDNAPTPGGVVAVVPHLPNAHLLGVDGLRVQIGALAVTSSCDDQN